MPVSKIDRTLKKLIVQLSHSQKKILVHYAKEMLRVKLIDSRQTIVEYNLEIDSAIQNVKQGNFTTLEDLKKEMKSW
jgi:hypothetical protein